MKSRLFVAFCLTALLGSAAAAAWAGPGYQAGHPDLVPTDVSWRPANVTPGGGVDVSITYENRGDTVTASEGTEVKFKIVVKSIGESPKEARVVEEDMSRAIGLANGVTDVLTCTLLAPAEEGDYAIVVSLDVGNAIDETDETNNTFTADQHLVVQNVLPPELAQLFAGLGLFTAVMAIMAVGTEVVIDTFKLSAGMKGKVSALATYKKLKGELPGQLTALGVDDEALKKVTRLMEDLDRTLGPLQEAANIRDQIVAGHFKEAVDAIASLKPGVADQELDRLRKAAKASVRAVVHELETTLHLNAALARGVESHLESEIDHLDVTASSGLAFAEVIFQRLREHVASKEQRTQWSEAWLRSQVDAFLTQTRTDVTKRLDRDVLPVLVGLGFEEESIRAMLNKALDAAEQIARDGAGTYVTSLRYLLEGVEQRRYELQSPLRKLYRRLRRNDEVSLIGFVIGAVATVGLLGLAWWAGVFRSWIPGASNLTILSMMGMAVLASVVGLGGGLLTGWLTGCLASKFGLQKGPSLGRALWWIENRFNAIRGSKPVPDQTHDKPDSDVLKQIESITPATVARILLEREDKHQDEEASRLRILRVISIVIGTILAYTLKIDALKLLNDAMPGIVDVAGINVGIPMDWLQPGAHLLTAGMLLTGFAASAGSAFWHDQLARLQSAKKQTEVAAGLLQQAKELVGKGE